MLKSKNILIAPLNWGLGHASRCIPIIKELIRLGHRVIIASDGKSLEFLKKEFPDLSHITLPSYAIVYPINGSFLKLKLLIDSPKIWNAIRKEHLQLKQVLKDHEIDLVISDNRMGLFTNEVPCVFITHQLQVLSGSTTWLSTQMHLHFIKKFTCCWIPDSRSDFNLSGKMSLNSDVKLTKEYIGSLSRLEFKKKPSKYKYDLLVVLSGPDPQRGILESLLRSQLIDYSGTVLFIAGKVEREQTVEKHARLTYCNYLTTSGLQKAMERSALVLCRSGYSTIMDLQKMQKKAFFIPTPGQYEQEYLASHLESKRIAPYCKQKDFSLKLLNQVINYEGFTEHQSSTTSISAALGRAFSNVKENSDPIPSSLST
jgi:uncharacterized protein (TIGR00661 family)